MSMFAQTRIRNILLAAALLAQAQSAMAESATDGEAIYRYYCDGEAIYRYYCYQCHGYAGDAQTLASASLSPPPRDFTSVTAKEFPIERIVQTVLNGREGTGMVSFASVLDEDDARAVAEYVRQSFMSSDRIDARYHSPENGWTNHYESACVSCHDQPNIGANEEIEWELRAVSYPRNHFSHRESNTDRTRR
jgi:cytochrome c oxidase cbb3-type subunit 3